jgi:hypothetical protein
MQTETTRINDIMAFGETRFEYREVGQHWAAILYIPQKTGPDKILASGFARRKEKALQKLEDNILDRCPDYLAYVRARQKEETEQLQYSLENHLG